MAILAAVKTDVLLATSLVLQDRLFACTQFHCEVIAPSYEHKWIHYNQVHLKKLIGHVRAQAAYDLIPRRILLTLELALLYTK
jgi:hypothetical protein